MVTKIIKKFLTFFIVHHIGRKIIDYLKIFCRKTKNTMKRIDILPQIAYHMNRCSIDWGEKMHQEEKNEYLCVHEDTVNRLLEEMPAEEDLYDLAELFKVFGDSTRIKILYALFGAELCVGDLAQLLGMSQTAVSHQLRVLRTNKLVKGRKEGKIVFYSLADDHVRTILGQGMDHVDE